MIQSTEVAEPARPGSSTEQVGRGHAPPAETAGRDRQENVGAAAYWFVHPCNLVTYVSLGSGALAMLTAVGGFAAGPGTGVGAVPDGVAASGAAAAAGLLLAVAVLADTFDGRFARLFRRSAAARRFGIQLDSLSDAVALGAAPVIVFGALLPPLPLAARAAWYAAGFAYLIAAVTRLGVYNVLHHDEGAGTHAEYDGFIGLPTPLAALVCASVLLAAPGPALSAAVLLGCAVLMVAPLRIARPRGAAFLCFVTWAAAVALLHGAVLAGGLG